jgi:hypothetical protein
MFCTWTVHLLQWDNIEKPVCTWGWRGTRQGAAACRQGAQCRFGIGESACVARLTATVLDGAAP